MPWYNGHFGKNRQDLETCLTVDKRVSNMSDIFSRGGGMNSPTQWLTSLTGGLNQRGQDHILFIISLFEGRNHHVSFRKNNRNNWLETVYFQIWHEEKSRLFFLTESITSTHSLYNMCYHQWKFPDELLIFPRQGVTVPLRGVVAPLFLGGATYVIEKPFKNQSLSTATEPTHI